MKLVVLATAAGIGQSMLFAACRISRMPGPRFRRHDALPLRAVPRALMAGAGLRPRFPGAHNCVEASCMLRRMAQALATSTARSAAAVSGGPLAAAITCMAFGQLRCRSDRLLPPPALSVRSGALLLAGRRRPPCHQRSCRTPALAVRPPSARGGWRSLRRRRRPPAARRRGSLAAPRRLRRSRDSRCGDLSVPGGGEAADGGVGALGGCWGGRLERAPRRPPTPEASASGLAPRQQVEPCSPVPSMHGNGWEGLAALPGCCLARLPSSCPLPTE